MVTGPSERHEPPGPRSRVPERYHRAVTLDPYRLPTSVRPSRYRLRLSPNLDTEEFEGTVSITAEVAIPTETVVLNADGLTIASASVRSSVSPDALACQVEIDKAKQRIALGPGQMLEPGPIEIEIAFSGRFDEKLVGLYASRFVTDDGVDRKLAVTQFEATYARKCFPCWDEPAFKAVFELELVIDPAHNAVTNGAEVSRRVTDDDRLQISFAPTMVMSTYLVAFVVGPLELSDPVDVDGTPLRIVHVPGKGHLTGFALEAGAFALRYFSDYFGLPYPGDKLDLVAIPDFAFGAMENLGCVTFREVLLLIEVATATHTELQRAADVVNHEIAHMWFGDLVTMKWWNGLWLNEAFATFMEMRCTDAFRPGWQRWVDFSLSRTEAFDTDALASTRPIEFEVVSPQDAEGMFDILTYEKGAAVVRMLEQYLGEDRFRDGIRRYMREHEFANADTTDLWDAIEAETGEPVRRIMDSWIFQGGFPLISVTGEATTPATVAFSQERMGYAGGDEVVPSTWAAPVLFRWRAESDQQARLERILVEQPTMETTLAVAPSWLLVNAGSTGFLRVAYTERQLDQLADIAIDELDPVERYALIDDAYAAVVAGRTSSIAFLNLIEAMSGESDRSVWQRLIGGLGQLDRLVDGEAQECLQDIAHDVMAPALANLGLAPRADDDDRTRQLRGDLVRGLGTVANDPEIQQEARRIVAAGQRDPELVDAALLAGSVEVVATIGDEADFDSFVDSWKSATTPQAEVRYLYALSEFTEPELVARVQELVLDGLVRSQNAPFLLARSLGNRHNGRTTWEFITEHWQALTTMFPSSSIVRMLSTLPRLDQPDQTEATAAFFSQNPVSSGSQTLHQLLEKQRVNAALRQREQSRLRSFLIA
jgi:puromycin-sensitive aminopeptidase